MYTTATPSPCWRRGAERYRYRGAEHLAAAGSFALLNPDEVHTGSRASEQGWRYRVFYPQPQQFRELLAELELPHQRAMFHGASCRADLVAPLPPAGAPRRPPCSVRRCGAR